MATTIFEKPMGAEVETLKGQIGTLSTLTTTNKQSAVSAINEINGNKVNYLFIDATSYTHNSKTGWDFAYGKIPDGYYGILKINFNGGYNVICTAYRQNSNWGSIIGHENSNHIPFFYNVQTGTSTLDELALNSNLFNQISSGTLTNLNTITKNGVYAYEYPGTGLPTSNGGVVLHCCNIVGNQGFQIAYPNNQHFIAIRYKVAGSWDDWKKIAVDNIS